MVIQSNQSPVKSYQLKHTQFNIPLPQNPPYATKTRPKPVPPAPTPIQQVHNLTLEKIDTAALGFLYK